MFVKLWPHSIGKGRVIQRRKIGLILQHAANEIIKFTGYNPNL
jgi:hypothetical protein